jgi:hydroxylaminobenzene mutase
MNSISQQFLISGTVLFLLSLLFAFAMPAFANPRMGVSAHVAGLQGAMTLWAFGLMWHRVALPHAASRWAEIFAVYGLYAIYASLLLAACWGTSRATPVAGAGHQAGALRETAVTVLLTGGSLASVAAAVMLLWGLIAWTRLAP